MSNIPLERRDRPPVPTVFNDLLAVYAADDQTSNWIKREFIYPVFIGLQTAWTKHPKLRPLIGGIAAAEAEHLLTVRPDKLAQKLRNHSRIANHLPDKPMFPQVEPAEMNLLDHDIAAILQEMVDNESGLSPAHERFLETNTNYGAFFFQLQARKNSPRLFAAYSDFLRLYTRHAVIPAINEALHAPNPHGHFDLLSVRSAFAEIALLNPLTFATQFHLQTTINHFVSNHSFSDKNTKKPVRVVITADSQDPLVYMDLGALYRMLRNLLRDAVTHGTGEIIRPIIRVSTRRGLAYLEIYSPGQLDEVTLRQIGRVPYTTRPSEGKHGYGKVGARQLLTEFWKSMGVRGQRLERLFAHHWQNVTFQGAPHVRWQAPIPLQGPLQGSTFKGGSNYNY